MNIPDSVLSHEVVTQWYRSPEILMKSEKYDLSADIWSVGCVISEMITGVPLFPYNDDEEQIIEMFRIFGTPTNEYWPEVRSFKRFPKSVSPIVGQGIRSQLGNVGNDLCQLLEDLLQLNPAKRITAKEALSYPVFKELSL
ncbi:negative regulator of the PHO system [Histomonas meleagridis]|uniref:negative regulator of the PHO system n=1 Tax=Histomonas meleagridis TaxID=135588 RepID=UPI003559E295|nr:negative regulator of the PHO system [Histomonas meleagridis]KAH0804851.1 negative regulator of the PHO system [Histomonas meleagridis]